MNELEKAFTTNVDTRYGTEQLVRDMDNEAYERVREERKTLISIENNDIYVVDGQSIGEHYTNIEGESLERLYSDILGYVMGMGNVGDVEFEWANYATPVSDIQTMLKERTLDFDILIYDVFRGEVYGWHEDSYI